MAIKSNNAQKSFKNISSDLFLQIITIAFGVIIPRLILVNLGSESNGLISSITQILTYVALLEAGVGAAALQALFLPIKSENKQKINEILAATDYFYKRTGILYLSVLLVLAFVFPFTIQTQLNYWTVSLSVLTSGIPSVISFFVQGKYTILLNAEGKNYITKNLSIYIYILNSILKIVLLNLGFGIVAVQSLGIIASIIQVVFISIYIHRHYKWIDLTVKADYASIRQSKNALVHQVAWLITSNTDTIILTYVCGLKVVSIYTMYRMLFGIIDNVINSLLNGVHFLMGQTFGEDVEQYKKIHRVYEVVIITLSFALFCITRIFVIPFLKLYTSGINDIDYIDKWLPYLFAIVHILILSRATSWETISVSGEFKKTQHQPIIEAIINFAVSIVLVFPLGIYGVLIGTCVASSYRLVSMIEFSNRQILRIIPWDTYKRYIVNSIVFVIITSISNIIFKRLTLDSYFSIIAFAAICTIIILSIFFIVAFIFDVSVFRDIKYGLKTRFKKSN